ncbi:hypothetical protein [Brumicola pallidula]|uniref:DUF4350 domain-containing protein n=1 Tax=Brumicola pallidula DSM 14239 = ACAM 615 TaxID=1121922 RepID=K6YAX7_9ALTE|nr:hypothetical protein [Glaciecola pallidula]GAC29894.1 hypothetical protein GPAL_3043 [Glaciecola pallidula DSM 14239 = ACAM 615]
MKLLPKLILVFISLIIVSCTDSSQQADPDFKPQNTVKSFSSDNSPVVLVDEAHNNFLTISGRYKPFEQVLSSNGFTVKSNTRGFTLDILKNIDILVIANALDHSRRDWQPPFGSALNDDEVASVKQWVTDGGSLLLIADHTPFPKVVENLAFAFGFEFSNGHVGRYTFRIADATLSAEHPITNSGNNSSNELPVALSIPNIQKNALLFSRITQVKTFGGSAFKAPDEAESLLTIRQGIFSTEPAIPFQVNSSTTRIPIEGWSQGAVLKVGKGRVAVFSEGMMFSSQVDVKTGEKHGLRSVGAEQNEQFLLNVMHWLSSVF